MSDRFTKHKLTWLDQVFGDRAITALCFKIAYAIASHMNREKLWAWPTYETLGNAVRADRRSVMRAIEVLARNGHLTVSRARGRHPNRYRWIIGGGEEPEFQFGEETVSPESPLGEEPTVSPESPLSNANSDAGVTVQPAPTVTQMSANGDSGVVEQCHQSHPEHFEEHSEEHVEAHNGKKRGGRRRKARAPIRANLEITEKQLADAANEGWNSDRARAQFPRFCDHARANARLLADVDAAWRNWVRKGIEIDARDRQRNGGGSRSAAEGIAGWRYEGGEEQ